MFVFYERSISVHAFYVVLGCGLSQRNTIQSIPINECFPDDLLADPFWFRKITTDPHIPAEIEYQGNRYPKLDVFTLELILNSYEYIAVAYIRMHFIIWF